MNGHDPTDRRKKPRRQLTPSGLRYREAKERGECPDCGTRVAGRTYCIPCVDRRVLRQAGLIQLSSFRRKTA